MERGAAHVLFIVIGGVCMALGLGGLLNNSAEPVTVVFVALGAVFLPAGLTGLAVRAALIDLLPGRPQQPASRLVWNGEAWVDPGD